MISQLKFKISVTKIRILSIFGLEPQKNRGRKKNEKIIKPTSYLKRVGNNFEFTIF